MSNLFNISNLSSIAKISKIPTDGLIFFDELSEMHEYSSTGQTLTYNNVQETIRKGVKCLSTSSTGGTVKTYDISGMSNDYIAKSMSEWFYFGTNPLSYNTIFLGLSYLDWHCLFYIGFPYKNRPEIYVNQNSGVILESMQRDDKWHHICATMSGASGHVVSLYVDGVKMGTYIPKSGWNNEWAGFPENPSFSTNLAYYPACGSRNIRYYKKELSSVEVWALYRNEKSALGV